MKGVLNYMGKGRVSKRYKDCIDEDFDTILLRIRNGTIKCGKYANSVKRQKIGKVLFSNERNKGK